MPHRSSPAPARRSLVRFLVVLGFWGGGAAVASDKSGEGGAVNFARDIAPILAAKCVTCHQPGKAKGGYELHTYAAFMTPGRSKEPPVVSGRPEKSPLIQLLLAKDPDDRMPQDDDPLPPPQIALLRKWIQQGARSGDIDPQQLLSGLAASATQPAPPIHYPRAVPILALAFNPAGTEVAAGGYHEVTVWDPSTGRLLRRIQNVARQVQQIAFSPDGRHLAVAAGTPGRLGEARIFDAATGKLLRTAGTAGDLMTTIAFSPDGRRLAIAGADNAIRLVDVESGSSVFRTELNADWVMHLAFSPDGKQIVAAGRDKTVRLVDAASGELEQTYADHSGPVFAAGYCADGRRVVSAGRDRELHLWQVGDAKKLGESAPLPAEVQRLLILGDRVVAGLSDGEIREYRVLEKKFEFVRTLGRHGDQVGALASHEESGKIASAGHDGRIQVTDLKEGKVQAEFPGVP